MIKNGGLYCDRCKKKVLVARMTKVWIPIVMGKRKSGKIEEWEVCENCWKEMKGWKR